MYTTSTAVRFLAIFLFVISIAFVPSHAQNYWEKLASPPSAHPSPLSVMSIVVTKPSTYLSATALGSGIYRSVDRGATWITSSPYKNYDHGVALCVNPAGHIFAVTNNTTGGKDITKIGRSKDDGVSYEIMPAYPETSPLHTMICTSNGTILIGTDADGLYRSKDDAATWTHLKFKSSSDSSVSCLLEVDNGTVYAGTEQDGIYQTKDYGDTWSLVVYSIALSNIKCLASDNKGNIYAGTSYGAYRSGDNGTTWEEIFSTGASGASSVSAIFITKEGRIFLSVFGTGAYCSGDSGASWTQIIKGLTTNSINTFSIDSTGNILMGTTNDIFRNTLAPVLNATVNINDQEINFGDLTYPAQKDSTITITNIGKSSLEISNISIEGTSSASFKVNTSSAISLAPDNATSIKITCIPAKNGDLDATLKFTSNTAGETSEIQLTGFATQVPVGVQEFDVVPFTVESYPNPSSGNSTIKIVSENSVNGTLDVVNLLGMPVYSREFSIESNTPLLLRCDIPTEAANGIYQAIITTGQHSLSIPITVVR